MAVLYASISTLNLMRAATGSLCREIKRGCDMVNFMLVDCLILHDGSPARRASQ